MFAARISPYRQMDQRRATALLFCSLVCVTGCGKQPIRQMPPKQKAAQAVETFGFAIEGMSCEGCASSVASAIRAVSGVKSVEVSLKEKRATVVGAVPPQMIEDAVDKVGFKAHLMVAGRDQSPIFGK